MYREWDNHQNVIIVNPIDNEIRISKTHIQLTFSFSDCKNTGWEKGSLRTYWTYYTLDWEWVPQVATCVNPPTQSLHLKCRQKMYTRNEHSDSFLPNSNPMKSIYEARNKWSSRSSIHTLLILWGGRLWPWLCYVHGLWCPFSHLEWAHYYFLS